MTKSYKTMYEQVSKQLMETSNELVHMLSLVRKTAEENTSLRGQVEDLHDALDKSSAKLVEVALAKSAELEQKPKPIKSGTK
jgi:hypothetical protein